MKALPVHIASTISLPTIHVTASAAAADQQTLQVTLYSPCSMLIMAPLELKYSFSDISISTFPVGAGISVNYRCFYQRRMRGACKDSPPALLPPLRDASYLCVPVQRWQQSVPNRSSKAEVAQVCNQVKLSNSAF